MILALYINPHSTFIIYLPTNVSIKDMPLTETCSSTAEHLTSMCEVLGLIPGTAKCQKVQYQNPFI